MLDSSLSLSPPPLQRRSGLGSRIICRLGPKEHNLEVAGITFTNRQEARAVVVTKDVQAAILAGRLQVISSNPPPRFLADSEDEAAEVKPEGASDAEE